MLRPPSGGGDDPRGTPPNLQQIVTELFQDAQVTCQGPFGPAFNLNGNMCAANSFLNVQTGQYEPFVPAAGDDLIGINNVALEPASCQSGSPGAHLPEPFGGLITNVQFLHSPAPVTDCSTFPNGPEDCAKCPSTYCEGGGLSCLSPGYIGVPVGPCIRTREGGSIQGWQCLRGSFTIDTSGACHVCKVSPGDITGYPSLSECESNLPQNQCSGHGTCQNVGGAGQCQCQPRYVKPDCSFFCPTRGSQNGNCQYEANCDWATEEIKDLCGARCDSFCGQGGYGWECLQESGC